MNSEKQMVFEQEWRAGLAASYADFAQIATKTKGINFRYGILGAALLWPVRETLFREGFNLLYKLCGGSAGRLSIVTSWSDPAEAARELGSMALEDEALQQALAAIIEHFDPWEAFSQAWAEALAANRQGEHSHYTAGDIKAGMVSLGNEYTADTIIFNLGDHGFQAKPPPPPFMARELPPDFIWRPAELEKLISFLRDHPRNGDEIAISAFHGAGGYGKTLLAQAVCHDERIKETFSDGILWVTIGQDPNPSELTGLTEDLIGILTNRRPRFASIDAAITKLKEALGNKQLLLVVDDVWDHAHLTPFIQGGPSCARLITTRQKTILPTNTQLQVAVRAMEQAEAVQLLAAGLTEFLDETHSALLHKLTDRLGGWPILVKLANGVLRQRVHQQPLLDALDYIDRALTFEGLTAFDARNAAAREEAVARTLRVSFDLLSEQEFARYRESAIFPGDVDIPLRTLGNFWADTGGLNEWETEKLCDYLYQLSLLLQFDLREWTIRLHDIIRTYLHHQQEELWPRLHARLLDVHRPTVPSPIFSGSEASQPNWADLPPEELYLWGHLVYHLVEAQRKGELAATVKDFRYLAIKSHIRNTLAVEHDLRAAEREIPEDAVLPVLRRHFVQASHLLNKADQLHDLATTLHSRLQHLKVLAPMAEQLAANISSPYITAWQPLPDLPHPALLRTLSGHTGWIRDCMISTDGQTIISASSDGTLKLWDAQSSLERLTLEGHMGWVNDCAISADGSKVVSASGDGTVKVWDIYDEEKEPLTLEGHKGEVNGCAISQDGSSIVSASEDHTLKVWDPQSGRERLTLIGHTDAVQDCIISADGKLVLSASSDQTVKVWDIETGEERLTLEGHSDIVWDCAISEDNAFIVSVSSDKTVRIWDASTGAKRATLAGHHDAVWACKISKDGAFIVSVSKDHTVRVWDVQTEQERYTLTGHTAGVRSCSISGNGTLIVSASDDYTLKVWNAQFEAELATPRRHVGATDGCAISADGSVIVSGSKNGNLQVWDRVTGRERHALKGHTHEIADCAVNADGSVIVSAAKDHSLKVWDGFSGTVYCTLAGHSDEVWGCAVSADGAVIVSASKDKTLKVWDGHSGSERFTLEGHTGEVNACAISLDGTLVVSASSDKTLKVWDAENGTERFSLERHTDWVRDCTISADGSVIVSASRDNTLKIWDAKTGTERRTLRGHSDGVWGCTTSADGSLVISVSSDATIRVWNAETGRCLSTLYVDGPLNDCALEPKNTYIVAAGASGVYLLRLANVPAPDIEQILPKLANETSAIRSRTIWALGMIGDSTATPYLLEMMNSEDRLALPQAIRALGLLGSIDAVPHLLDRLNDGEGMIRRAAAWSLGQIGDESAAFGLHETLEDPVSLVRQTAAQALSKIGWQPADLEQQVLFAVASQNWDECIRLGTAARDELVESLSDEDPDVRDGAAAALGKAGDPATVSSLVDVLQDPVSKVRRTASKALANLGWEPPDLDLKVHYAIASQNWDECVNLGTASSAPLAKVLTDDDRKVHQAVVRTLGRVGDSSIIPHLEKALRNEDQVIRKLAAEALGTIGSCAAAPYLENLLSDPEKSVRRAAAEALEQVAWQPSNVELQISHAIAAENWDDCLQLGAKAIPQLKEFLKDGDRAICEAAARTILKLQPLWDEAFSTIGDVFNNLREYPEALTIYDLAVELFPEEDILYVMRGYYYSNEKKAYELALADYNRAIELRGRYYGDLGSVYYAYRASVRVELGDYKAALLDLTRAIEMNPEGCNGYQTRGNFYQDFGQYEAAVADFKHALRVHGEADTAYSHFEDLGTIHYYLRNHDSALTNLTQALELEPEKGSCFLSRTLVHLDLGDYWAALKDVEAITELDYLQPRRFFWRSLIHRMLGQGEEAQEYWQKATALADTPVFDENDRREQLKLLAKMALLDGNPERAIEYYTQLFDMGLVSSDRRGEFELLEQLQRLLPARGDIRVVSDWFEYQLPPKLISFLNVDDEDSNARRAVAEILGGMNDPAAIPILEKALEDPVPTVSQAAARSLQRFDWQPIDKGQEIKYTIGTRDWEACERLGSEVVPDLLAALAEPTDPARRDYVQVLGQIGDSKAVPTLLELLTDSDRHVRQAALEALAPMRDETLMPHLLNIVRNDEYTPMRISAANEIMCAGDAATTAELFAFLRADRSYGRAEIVRGLGNKGNTSISSGLLTLLDDDDAGVRRAAVEALGRIKDPATIPGLLAIYHKEALSLQNVILSCLKSIRTSDSLTILEPEIDVLLGTWDGVHSEWGRETEFEMEITDVEGQSFRGTVNEPHINGDTIVQGVYNDTQAKVEFTKKDDNRSDVTTYSGEVVARNFVSGSWRTGNHSGKFLMKRID